MLIDQYSVYWVDLNPTRSAEINKTRPYVVISPPEMNAHLKTILVAPVTSRAREGFPTRLPMTAGDVTGWIVLDQIRAIDKTRLHEKIGALGADEVSTLKSIIKEMLVD